jgi:hypothetical protein
MQTEEKTGEREILRAEATEAGLRFVTDEAGLAAMLAGEESAEASGEARVRAALAERGIHLNAAGEQIDPATGEPLPQWPPDTVDLRECPHGDPEERASLSIYSAAPRYRNPDGEYAYLYRDDDGLALTGPEAAWLYAELGAALRRHPPFDAEGRPLAPVFAPVLESDTIDAGGDADVLYLDVTGDAEMGGRFILRRDDGERFELSADEAELVRGRFADFLRRRPWDHDPARAQAARLGRVRDGIAEALDELVDVALASEDTEERHRYQRMRHELETLDEFFCGETDADDAVADDAAAAGPVIVETLYWPGEVLEVDPAAALVLLGGLGEVLDAAAEGFAHANERARRACAELAREVTDIIPCIREAVSTGRTLRIEPDALAEKDGWATPASAVKSLALVLAVREPEQERISAGRGFARIAAVIERYADADADAESEAA